MERILQTRLQEKLDQLKEASRPEPIRSDGCGALDLGPRNLKRDEEFLLAYLHSYHYHSSCPIHHKLCFISVFFYLFF